MLDQEPGPIHSAAYLSAVLDSVPTAVVVVDVQGNIVLVNSQAEQLFGYARDSLLGETVDILVPYRFRVGHPRLRASFIQEPKARPMGAGRDLYGLRRDGSEFPIEIGLNPITTPEGLFVVSAIIDISERKRLEARFRATVESAPTAMVMIDQAGTLVLANAEANNLFGYDHDELLGKKVEILIPQRFSSDHPRLRSQYFANPQARRMGAGRDLYALHKDGSEFPVEIGLNPVQTDEGSFVLAAIVDITERKRLETRFRATVESAPTAMVMVDREGNILLANAEATRLFGYDPGELLGLRVESLVPARFSGEHPRFRAQFAAAPEARPMGAGRDLYGLRRDGSEFPIEIGLNPLRTDEGSFVLVAIVDITERKRLEAILRESNEALELRVAERTTQLNRQKEELQQSIEALLRSNMDLQRFAYIASHDLQSPLRSIAGFVQLLQMEYGNKLDARAEEWIRRTVKSVEQLQVLIRDLLAYSRVDTQAHPFESIAFADVVRDTLLLLEASVRDSGAEVSYGELPVVMGDRPQLIQLMQNLIGNALKFRGDAPPRVQISANRADGVWVISVRDNGIGISPRQHERIFEIFQRAHSQQEYPGTGIGLAVCRRVVHRHGGRIWVESEPGQGSTFHFTIPELMEEHHERSPGP